MMTIQLLVLLVAVVINLALGIMIWLREPRSRMLQSVLLLALVTAVWAPANFLTEQASDLAVNRACNTVAYVAAYILAMCFMTFCYYYANRQDISKPRTRAGIVLILIGLVFSGTSYVTGQVHSSPDGGVTFVNGPLLAVYGLMLLLITAHGFSNLAYRYRHSFGREKTQARLTLVSFATALIIGLIGYIIFPLLLPNWKFSDYGPLITVVLISSMTYAIARFGSYDIWPMLTRTIVYVLSSLAVTALFVTVFYQLANRLFPLELSANEKWVLGLFMAAGALLFQPITMLFEWLSGLFVYRDRYDQRQLLNAVNTKIATTAQLDELLHGITSLIEKQLKVDFCNFYLEPQSNIDYHLVGSNKGIFSKASWTAINDLLRENVSTVLSVADLGRSEPIREHMVALNIDLMLKMTSNGEDVGYMILGQKRSKNHFLQADIETLNIIADEAALAVQSALRFKEIERFNETLQQKIDDATKELKVNNQKLRSLDDAKDEFISMASHQLRTPLTSIKGYLSMILEGDVGEISAQQKTFLNQAYISSQRMVYLISDLLNVSRLKTGKFVIDPTDVYLPAVVRLEVGQLEATAEAHGLTLNCEVPEEFPELRLDETKIRQVIMNFIDNAIYYTPSGGKITVKLTETAHTVDLIVTDNGIGVPRSEQHRLFNKFYRATNARNARPDGTGLGLFMAKKVIMAQGGALIFQSVEGEGSTFGFTLPKAKLRVLSSAQAVTPET